MNKFKHKKCKDCKFLQVEQVCSDCHNKENYARSAESCVCWEK